MSEPSPLWEYERLFFNGDQFYSELEKSLLGAQESIDVEMYIFESDHLGERMFQVLAVCAKRGVKIRMIIDAIGSPSFRTTYAKRAERLGIQILIYHDYPWNRSIRQRPSRGLRFQFRQVLQTLNRRNHRKLWLLDRKTTWTGSFNVSEVHLPSAFGSKAWRDTGLCVQGSPSSILLDAFEFAWNDRRKRFRRTVKNWLQAQQTGLSTLVRMNYTQTLRRFYYNDLLNRITSTKEMIWITNPYFVPPLSLLRALSSAARSGVDVRLLLPRESDIFFMQWVAAAFFETLLKAGVRIFEYTPSVLHAKTVICDDWSAVGSSNLNRRSLLHDLEIDIVLTSEETKRELKAQFLRDLKFSAEVTLQKGLPLSFFKRMIGRLFLLIRYFL